MHPNPSFRQETEQQHIEFAKERGFGTLIVNAGEHPLASHVPFILKEDVAEFHLVRSNPIVRLLKSPVAAMIAVTGPDAYISPDWYGVDNQVPTWNYVAVHVRGTLSLRPSEELQPHLIELSKEFERRLNKVPWKIDKMDAEPLARLMRMIVPARLEIDSVEGTWKLNQNKDESARQGAIEGLEHSGVGSEIAMLRNLMKRITE